MYVLQVCQTKGPQSLTGTRCSGGGGGGGLLFNITGPWGKKKKKKIPF